MRGGILDVFPPTEEHPLRLEFWGDTVEEIRWFKVADQRSLEVAEHGLWAPPCRELLLTDAVRQRAAALADQLPGVADLLEKLSQGIAVEGMESLAPALVDGMETLLDVLPEGALLVACDPERVRTRAHDLVSTSQEFLEAGWANAASGNSVPIDLQSVLGTASFRTLAELRAQARDLGVRVARPHAVRRRRGRRDHRPRAGGGADLPRQHRRGRRRAGSPRHRRLVGAGRHRGPRLRQARRRGARRARRPGRLVDDEADPEPGVVTVTTGAVGAGFLAPGARLAVVTETDLTGSAGGSGTSTKDMRRMPSRRRNQVDPLQLRPGDFVVHEQHGVGRFVEMMQRTVAGATREYLVLEYAPSRRGHPGDRLYVPTDQLDQVTRYVGGEQPSLNKMGGSDWHQTKSRARRYVKQIAAELIRLYSARMATSGHAFGPDTPWQRELEDAFAHVETPDQLSTIDEVKADMERPVPMDRLVCGDVGYGKTEIAVRAAFKAVQEGKQVAVLCPTTLLVQQHVNTFSERYAGFPVVVRALSRFQTDREAKEVLDGLASGAVDLVIGTHRLLGAEVRFKDLGLVVVDEEQRFGVEHKEQLKALRTSVDVLAMSATPIPRTLEMAVTGIREMSTLQTPPEERHPVLTYVGAYDEKTVTAAIRRELMREGQVFHIHNKVSTIEKAAARIRELVPEARIAVAHGKLGEHRLEQVVLDFWEKRFDVLVCTTIVETGLDISNANTLIVERADRLGLSQLHQLRGRVGRGRERAYSYFLYPPEVPLTETALDRLQTIASHTDLGAGMQVAMKDLEIRGAGNLLGGEQSGHIAGVGFDLYVRLVGEAVASFRGETDEAPWRSRSSCRSTPTCRTTTSPTSGCVSRCTRSSPPSSTRRSSPTSRPSSSTATARRPSRCATSSRWRGCARWRGRPASATSASRATTCASARVELRESQELRLQRLHPRSIVKPAQGTILVPKPMTARVAGRPLSDREVLDWAGEVIRSVVMDNVGRPPGWPPPVRSGTRPRRTARDSLRPPLAGGARRRSRARHGRLRRAHRRPGRRRRRLGHHRDRLSSRR